MRIDHLEIHNFRCFASLKLDLHPEFNVLIGENGAGKTAFLEALAAAVGEWLRAMGWEDTRSIQSADVRIVGRRFNHDTQFEPQMPVFVRARGRVGDLPAKWLRTLGADENQDARPVDAVLRRLAKEASRRVSAGEEIRLPLVAYYGAGRLWPALAGEQDLSPLTQRELSRLEGYRDALTARTGARELTRWIVYQDYAAYREKEESPVYRAVLNAMRGMAEKATDVRFDAKRLEVVVEFENGEVRPFALLSDGQRNMLALAGDMAMRMARLNPQFDPDVLKQTPGIVLIDELDLHLHPRWQRHVVEDLRRTFPLIQFVTTTHSPQIVGELRPENIIMLGEQEQNGKPPQSYGMDTNFILRHLMHTDDRKHSLAKSLGDIENLIRQEEYDKAQQSIDALRAEVGEFADLVRLQARINKILLLSR